MRRQTLWIRTWMVLGGVGMVGLLVGCGRGSGRPEGSLPKLQPVRGQLLRAGKPVSGGAVRLEPIAPTSASLSGSQNLSIAGNVGPDGQFEVVTLHTLSMQSGSGAPVGQYRVTYVPAFSGSGNPEDQAAVLPITLPQPVTIQEGSNDLKLSLDSPSAKKR